MKENLVNFSRVVKRYFGNNTNSSDPLDMLKQTFPEAQFNYGKGPNTTAFVMQAYKQVKDLDKNQPGLRDMLVDLQNYVQFDLVNKITTEVKAQEVACAKLNDTGVQGLTKEARQLMVWALSGLGLVAAGDLTAIEAMISRSNKVLDRVNYKVDEDIKRFKEIYKNVTGNYWPANKPITHDEIKELYSKLQHQLRGQQSSADKAFDDFYNTWNQWSGETNEEWEARRKQINTEHHEYHTKTLRRLAPNVDQAAFETLGRLAMGPLGSTEFPPLDYHLTKTGEFPYRWSEFPYWETATLGYEQYKAKGGRNPYARPHFNSKEAKAIKNDWNSLQRLWIKYGGKFNIAGKVGLNTVRGNLAKAIPEERLGKPFRLAGASVMLFVAIQAVMSALKGTFLTNIIRDRVFTPDFTKVLDELNDKEAEINKILINIGSKPIKTTKEWFNDIGDNITLDQMREIVQATHSKR